MSGIVTPRAAAGRVLAPSVLQAQAAGDVVGFALQNNQSAALGQRVITFQQVFLAGQVAVGAHLTATINGQKIPVQMDVKTTNSDGSVRMAILTLTQPAMAANSSLAGMLSTTGAASASPLSLTALDASRYNLKITIALHGGKTVTLDAATVLQHALTAGTVSYWQKGPLATQGRVDVAIAGSLHVTLDITLRADGSIATDVQFNNDYAMQSSGGTVAYDLAISQNGKTELQQSNITQYQYQTWHRTVSSNGESQVNIVRDIAYLERTGAVPGYDLSAGVDASVLAGEVIADNGILGAANVGQYMPTTGGRPDIGPTTGWNAVWLMTQNQQAANYALAQADAAGSVPWHYFDPKTNTYLSLKDYPTLWADPRGTPTLTQQPSDASGWTPDAAHQPDLSYVAYLLTGSRYYLDQLNAQATYAEFATWQQYRQNGQGLVANGADQVRAQAWSLRQIDEAAWANPDGSAEKANFTALSNNNWHWLVSQIPAWTQQQGEAHGYIPGDYRQGSSAVTGMAPWQQDYFASTAIQAAQHGNADALTFLKWEANFLVGRFLNAANGFNPHDGVVYNLIVGDGAGVNFKTWAQIGQATVANGQSNGNGWPNADYAALAAQTLAGIITVTGSADAVKAYNWLLSSDAPQIHPFLEPQLDIVPVNVTATHDAVLGIVATSAAKGEGASSASTPFTFTVTRSGDATIAASAKWAVTGSGASPASGSDFVGGALPTGTVSFAAGETTKTITVNVAGDSLVEPDEGFTVTLSGASGGAAIGVATATGAILDDDGTAGAATLSIKAASATKAEGASGASTPFTFTVTRTGNTAIAASASWAVTGSSADMAGPSDFVGRVMPTGTVSFAAGETTKTITVNVAGDSLVEPDNGFTVTLSGASGGAAIGVATATGAILNDDSATGAATLSIKAASATKAEGASGASTPFTFTVTRTGNTAIAASASWAVTGSSADMAGPSDFVGRVMPTGTVSFAAGETTKTITVNVAGDSLVEPDNGFTVVLAKPGAASTIVTATAGGLILNDDGGANIIIAGASTTTQVGTTNTVIMPAGGGTLYSRGSDTIYAGAGADDIHVDSNTVSVSEGSGRMSFIDGYGSHATITMRAGNAGSDLMMFGDNTINAAGTFTANDGGAGAGADYFNITKGVLTHISIVEFGDYFHLSGFESSEAAHVVATAQSSAAGEVLSFSDGSTATLAGWSSASLDWFR